MIGDIINRAAEQERAENKQAAEEVTNEMMANIFDNVFEDLSEISDEEPALTVCKAESVHINSSKPELTICQAESFSLNTSTASTNSSRHCSSCRCHLQSITEISQDIEQLQEQMNKIYDQNKVDLNGASYAYNEWGNLAFMKNGTKYLVDKTKLTHEVYTTGEPKYDNLYRIIEGREKVNLTQDDKLNISEVMYANKFGYDYKYDYVTYDIECFATNDKFPNLSNDTLVCAMISFCHVVGDKVKKFMYAL